MLIFVVYFVFKKRVRVYLNGQSADKTQICSALNMKDLFEEIETKLGLKKPIKCLFTTDGKQVYLVYFVISSYFQFLKLLKL